MWRDGRYEFMRLKYFRVSLATTPESRRIPIIFGIAISALVMSETFQISFNSIIVPSGIRIVNKIR